MKKKLKKISMVLLSSFLFLFSFKPLLETVNAQENSLKEISQSDFSKIKNYESLLVTLLQNEEDIISAYWLDEAVKSGVINIYNKKEDKYYNLYVEEDSINYYSVQYYVDKESGDANFELYSVGENNVITHEYTSTILKETGEVNHTIGTYSSSNAVYKWACIFSSRIACIAAAGTLGFGVAGPFGATAATLACGYVFGTLVEKYGSKEAACKIFS
ncbi:hypothetical protein [Lysinibacillus sp. 3P01SB]|uniref:hypothetical protein n=1 Tax=Lysinibacillus sp. 3P01SB TaxID=3132284 RepID=UPI0039A47F9B